MGEQRPGHLRGQPRLTGPGLTADENRLAIAPFDALPGLLEHREFRAATHERAAATSDQLGRERGGTHSAIVST